MQTYKKLGPEKINELLVPKILHLPRKNERENETFMLGIAQYLKSDYYLAAKSFAELVRKNCCKYESLNNLGCCYVFLGQIPKTVQCFQQAIILIPSETVYFNLALAYVFSYNFTKAFQTTCLYKLKPSEEFNRLKSFITGKMGISPIRSGVGREETPKESVTIREERGKEKGEEDKKIQNYGRVRSVANFDTRNYSIFQKLPKTIKEKESDKKKIPKNKSIIMQNIEKKVEKLDDSILYYGKSYRKQEKVLKKVPTKLVGPTGFIQENLEIIDRSADSYKIFKFFNKQIKSFYQHDDAYNSRVECLNISDSVLNIGPIDDVL
jgi:tetratricopeptide (TPR) repeat protein